MIYILQFEQPLGNPAKSRGQARYYIGYCDDGKLEQRISEHRSGTGAKITRAAVRNGIGFRVVITLPGDRAEERRLKKRKNTPKLVAQLLKRQQREAQ